MPSPLVPQLNREPNVVPMIDLLLVLLVIFIINALQREGILPVQLPEELSSAEATETPIVLEVKPGPTYALNQEPVAAEALASRLREVFAGRPRKVLYVRGDRGVRYQDVVTAWDVARGAGVHATGVMLDRP